MSALAVINVNSHKAYSGGRHRACFPAFRFASAEAARNDCHFDDFLAVKQKVSPEEIQSNQMFAEYPGLSSGRRDIFAPPLGTIRPENPVALKGN